VRNAVKHRHSERSSAAMCCCRLMEIAASIPRQEPLRINRSWLLSRCARSQPRALCFAQDDVEGIELPMRFWWHGDVRGSAFAGRKGEPGLGASCELRSGRAQSYPAIRLTKPHEKPSAGHGGIYGRQAIGLHYIQTYRRDMAADLNLCYGFAAFFDLRRQLYQYVTAPFSVRVAP